MPRFVVHEHHAKKLHYDLRLEIDGVLKSWAVPKGPSMSPSDKRLAVMVEDHPLEYAGYEGIIPGGFYGAGPVIIWDSGDFELLRYEMVKGAIDVLLHGTTLKGAFFLTRLKGKDKDWLMIKKRDAFALQSFTVQPRLTEERRAALAVIVPPCDAR